MIGRSCAVRAVKGAEAVVDVGLLQPVDGHGAGAVHGHPVEEAGAGAGADGDDLGAVGLLQPLAEGGHDHRGRQVLVLQEDGAAGGGDAGQVQAIALLRFRPVLPLGFGAGQGHIDPDQVFGEGFRPGRVLGHLRRGQRPAAGVFPPLDEQLGAGLGDRSLGHHRHVMAGRIALAPGQAAAGVEVEVVAGVPPVGAQVAAADEGQAAIDDQHLLMVAGAGRQAVVEPELDRRALEIPLGPLAGKPLGHGDDRRHVPGQDADIQRRIERRNPPEKLAQPVGVERIAAALAMVGLEPGQGIEHPGQQPDRLFRRPHGVLDGGEVVRPIHQKRHPVGGVDTPAGVSGGQQAFGLAHGAPSGAGASLTRQAPCGCN